MRDDLHKVLFLRQTRLQRAERALAHQHAECEAARAAVVVAAARVVAQRRRQDKHERVLLAEIVGRAVTVSDIERARSAFTLHEEQRANVERAEGATSRAMRAAFEARRLTAAECTRRRHEHDKLAILVAHVERIKRRRDEVYAEADNEEGVRAAQGSPPGSSC
jgi:hypothetical protein